MGVGKGDENVRAWDGQWGRGTEWKSIERDMDRERPSYFFSNKITCMICCGKVS